MNNSDIFHIQVANKKARRGKSKKKKASYLDYQNRVVPPNETNEQYFLGEFHLGTTNNSIPENWELCSCTIQNFDYALFHFDDDSTVVVSLLVDTPIIKDIVSTKIFALKFMQNEENVWMSLYFKQIPIPNFTKKILGIIKDVFQILFQIDKIQNTDAVENEDSLASLHDTYKKVRESQRTNEYPKYEINTAYLKPRLRPYQIEAVKWMINREKQVEPPDMLHPAYIPIKLQSGIVLYYNKFIGHFDLKPPIIKSFISGGILADEMGLGKTIEILCCILSNRKESETEENNEAQNATSSPTVFKQIRKRVLNDTDETFSAYVDKPKKIKVRDDWVKKGKTATRVALETWYNSVLTSVYDTPSKQQVPEVFCVCGSRSKSNLIKCVDCMKQQHQKCMGYSKNYGVYRCPQCWKKMPLIESKATFIVCPTTLKEQWTNEICKHIKSGLSVFHYQGSSATPVYPIQLKEFDLVITTYSVLQADLHLATNTESDKKLRNQPKYAQPGSPITLIKWWRLCFDEAQIFESSASMITEMAHKLNAYHWWAITGTPVSKGLVDLFNLIDFLRYEPYNEVDTWNNILYLPYINGQHEEMIKIMSKIMWRTLKKDVEDQIQIPPQTTNTYHNDFTAIERYYYDREHEMSRNDFLAKLRQLDLNLPLHCLNKRELKLIMEPLLSLRQVCAHHTAVKGRYLVNRKTVNSMSELLDALIAKNLSDSEDHLRAIISCLNGKAGLYLLLQNPPQAIEEYRKVLQLVAKFSEDKSTGVQLVVDKLQQIHTLHNLSEILDANPSLEKTLRDDRLRSDCLEMEKVYVNKFNIQTIKSIKNVNVHLNGVAELEKTLELKEGQWYSAAVEKIVEINGFDDLITKVDSKLENWGSSKVSPRVKDFLETRLRKASQVEFLNFIRYWDDDLPVCREETIDAVNKLFSLEDGKVLIDRALVQEAAECHLRPTGRNKKEKKICTICETNFHLKKYEEALFSSMKKSDDLSNKGSWKSSVEEQMLRVIYSIAKAKSFDPEIIREGATHLKLLDLYKPEFKEIRKLWTNIDAQTCSYDEIDICKIRLQLKVEDDEDLEESKKSNPLKNLSYVLENQLANINQLRESELDYQLANIQSEEIAHNRDLEKCLGTHKYLKTLHHQQDQGENPDPCPICKTALDTKWNILKCGHCYCIDCLHVLLGQNSGKYVQCSICREKLKANEINYVEIKQATAETSEDKIKGNCSTKIEDVVKLILKLKNEEEGVKILVFSNWMEVLKVFKEICELNNIGANILSVQHIEKTLETFKDESKGITVLLMPVKLGARGLNLIEATHVIFVEPLLDPADEQQAVGRVHRIGQTKPTFVHKFLIKDSIEINIHLATTTNSPEWSKSKVTLKQIKDLFMKVPNYLPETTVTISEEIQNLEEPEQTVVEQEQNEIEETNNENVSMETEEVEGNEEERNHQEFQNEQVNEVKQEHNYVEDGNNQNDAIDTEQIEESSQTNERVQEQ